MKYLILSALFVLPFNLHARECKSELLRVDVTNEGLKGTLNSLLPALSSLARSEKLSSLIERDFPLSPLAFPHSQESCLQKKADNDPHFKSVNCSDRSICQSPTTNPEVRKQLCFALPCPILEGTLNVGKCQNADSVFPTMISFPQPVSIKEIRLNPVSVNQAHNKVKLCFKVEALEVETSVSLALDTSKTAIPDKLITIAGLDVELDSPKDVCIEALIDLSRADFVKDIDIIPSSKGPIISEQMIRSTAAQLQVSGISGYTSQDLKKIQKEVIPVLFHPLRSVVETAIIEALGEVFKDELNSIVKRSFKINGESFMSELGVSNFMVKSKVDLLECATLQAARKEIPASCEPHAHYGLPGEPKDYGPVINAMMNLPFVFEGKSVTSESIKQSLLNAAENSRLEPPYALSGKENPEFLARVLEAHRQTHEDRIKEYITPQVDRIIQNQKNSPLPSLVTLKNEMTASGRKFALAIEDVCSTLPSPHAKKKMLNCPIQVYADLNDFNHVLKEMWSAGRMCMTGKGKFTPKLHYGAEVHDNDGRPVAEEGCGINIQGLTCYIKSAPQLSWNAQTKRYQTKISLEKCFRGPVILGQGKFGGDFIIDLAFKPSACENGDFCVKDPEASWKLVPGTERFALRSTSALNGFVTDALNKAIVGSLSQTIRIPLSSAGFLGSFPLKAEGRTDAGAGYFGVCLKPADQ